MEILQFVKLDEVDPIYFESSYFSTPEEAGARAYALLLKAMVQLKYAAIAKVTLHQRERTVVIRPYDNGLTLHTIYYPDEIRELKEYGKSPKTELRKQEVALAEQFAKSLLKPFKPEEFHDEYRRQVEKLVESKNNGKALPRPEKQPKLAPVIDLMSALKKSLAGTKAAPKATGSVKGKRLQKTA
jgi:DNA end-binding protein Ku